MITISRSLATPTTRITGARSAVLYIFLGVLLGAQLRSGQPLVPVALFATSEPNHFYNVTGLEHTSSTTCDGTASSLFLSNTSVVDSTCRCIWRRTSESPQTPMSSPTLFGRVFAERRANISRTAGIGRAPPLTWPIFQSSKIR